MARFKILEDSFIDNRMVKAGEEIDTDAIPGTHWEPLDKDAKDARKDSDAALAEHNAKRALRAEAVGTIVEVLADAGLSTP